MLFRHRIGSPGIAPGGHFRLFQQRLPRGAEHGTIDTALFEETNFRLGRVNVDIEHCRIERYIDDGYGMSSAEQQRVIRFFQGGGEHAAEHPATIDEEGYVLPRALVTGGEAGIATDDWSLWIAIVSIKAADGNHLLGHLQTIDFDKDT